MAGGTNFDNAYNSSREPIPGFDANRIQGVENFRRGEHFLYLKQRDPADPRSNVDPAQLRSQSDRFSKVRQYVQERPDLKSIARGRKATRLALLGVSAVFCIACSIGFYW